MKSTEAPLPNLCSRIAGSAIPKARSLALVRIGTVEVQILPTQIGRQRTARSNDETPIRAYASQLVAYFQTDPLRLTSQRLDTLPLPIFNCSSTGDRCWLFPICVTGWIARYPYCLASLPVSCMLSSRAR